MKAFSIFLVCLISLETFASLKRPKGDNLTRSFAQFRKSQIEKVDYELNFVFDEKSESFKGHTVILTTLKTLEKALSIDFTGKLIESIIVNDKVLKNWKSTEGSIEIPAQFLKNQTRIEIKYSSLFNKEGHGFQRIIDTEDKSVYIYSDTEPYYAHTFFPCFDQPDLKASFQTRVTAPHSWLVISNELIANTEEKGSTQVITFRKTLPISTYLYFLGAGNFVEWKDSLGDLPLVLYARKSIAKHVDVSKIFESTKKGLKFYNEYFGTPYPFSKYGQVFVPEFAWGGMENPGAVTLSESNIFRGPATLAHYEKRDDLILHEMAHMWFGNLVTMNWWDDLWLNESFATYLAELAGQRAFHAKSAILSSISGKGWGYWQDQLVTTHPIETEVIDTSSAKGNFDGITYAKGSASLKQLHYFVGEKGFREGLKNYFKKYAFQNTSRADFMNEIALASKVNLDTWTKAWLQSAGPHRVQAEWTCDKNNKIESFRLEQKPNASGILSPHKTQIAFFNIKSDKLKLSKTQEVIYSEMNNPVPSLIGVNCPDFVFPNLDDYDYALFSLDEKSKSRAELVLTGGVEQNTLRLMTWEILSQMVRDSKLSILEYFKFVLSALEKENDEALLAILFDEDVSIQRDYYTFLSLKERNELAPKLEAIVFKRLEAEPAQSNLQMTFFDFAVSISHTQSALQRINDYLSGKDLPTGFKLDQDRRWDIIQKLAYYDFKGIKTQIDAEEKADPSSIGKKKAFASRVAIPQKSVKQDFWKQLEKPEQIPYGNLRSAAGRFHSSNNQKLSQEFVKPFFKRVTTLNWKEDDELAEIYFDRIFPFNICSKSLLDESQKQLKSAHNLTPLSKRYWLEANDELAKCVAVRNFVKSVAQH